MGKLDLRNTSNSLKHNNFKMIMMFKTNIILHGLPPDVHALVNHQEMAKDIWDRIKMLMKGTELSYQELNTKFLNALPSEWSKFATYVKLAKSLYTTNYDQLYAYLSQHERHANEVLITRKRYLDPLAFQGDDLIDYINKAMAFLSAVASSRHGVISRACVRLYLEHIIVAGAANRPSMLEKSMCDSWASRIHLFIKGKKHGRMMLDSIDNGPLVYPAVEENGQTRPKKYKLTEAQQLQDDYDVQNEYHSSRLDVPMFQQGDDPIDYINKAMAFLSAVASRFPPSNNQLITSSNPRNQATIQDDDLDAYDSDCDDLSSAKAVLMANLSSRDPEVLSVVPYFDSYPNDMINQDVQEMQY
nr:hypothetical protein [Tanacetum cinerariifolium]